MRTEKKEANLIAEKTAKMTTRRKERSTRTLRGRSTRSEVGARSSVAAPMRSSSVSRVEESLGRTDAFTAETGMPDSTIEQPPSDVIYLYPLETLLLIPIEKDSARHVERN